MLPQIVGPGTFTPSPLAPPAAERVSQGAQPLVGETAAAATRPETANRVEPPRVLTAPLPLPDDRRAREPLVPPDPDAPAGPPPAFEATPLERAREAALGSIDLIPDRATPQPEEATGDDAPTSMAADREARPAAGDPEPPDTPRAARPDDLREKVEADVARVRRMAEPEPERTVDVTR